MHCKNYIYILNISAKGAVVLLVISLPFLNKQMHCIPELSVYNSTFEM